MPTRRLIPVVIVLTVLSVSPIEPFTDEYTLLIESVQSTERLVTEHVSEGSTVTLSYTHSVEKTPVHDVYTVEGEHLDNTRMRFKSYGWGLPSRENVTLRNGWFEYDPDSSYTELYVKPGRLADHTITVNDRSYDLVELSKASSVRISIDRRSAPFLYSGTDGPTALFHPLNPNAGVFRIFLPFI